MNLLSFGHDEEAHPVRFFMTGSKSGVENPCNEFPGID